MSVNETGKILNQDEKVIWEGQPQRLPFILPNIVSMLLGIAFIVFGLVWISFTSSDAPWFFSAFAVVPILIGLSMAVLNPLYKVFLYNHVWYVITDKRIIFQSGIIGRDFDYVDYDKVESATVNVGIIDKLFGKNSGSLAIYANRLVSNTTTDQYGRTSTSTSNVPFVLSHVTDPYKVFELFKNISFNVKADINYPNALRPKTDGGYQTEYTDQVSNTK